jgi:pilus assembly protein CpaE
LRRNHASVPVILVLSSLDSGLILDAMRAGVTECLAEPVTESDVANALDRVASVYTPTSIGRVFAFVGAKGGVGATTTAVNVATELARGEKNSVLVLDLHLAYGDAALYLGAEPSFSVADALENTHRLDQAFLRSVAVRTKVGPDLLASPERRLPGGVSIDRIRTLIEAASRYYRYVVLDLPRSEPMVLDALDSASRVVVIANQELPTVRAAGRMASTLRQRYGKERVSVVVTRYDPEAGIGQDDIERVVGMSVKHILPSDYRLAVEAINSGRPLTLTNHNRLSGAFCKLARDLAGLPAAEKEEAQSGGLFNRLLGRR